MSPEIMPTVQPYQQAMWICVACLKEAFTLYRQYVNDEWTDLLETIWEKYRNELAYKIPEGKVEREQLHKLCEEVLAFENHFFALFRDFALQELKAITSGWRKAAVSLIGQLGRIVFPDVVDEMIDSLR